jgi:hypothetical protein
MIQQVKLQTKIWQGHEKFWFDVVVTFLMHSFITVELVKITKVLAVWFNYASS